MFLQPDGTFFIQLINFAIFFALLNWLFLRPVSRAIRERRAFINGLVTEYDSYQAQGQSLREQADGIRAEARRDAEQTVTRARADASNAAAEIAAVCGQQGQRIAEEAQRTVAAELASVRTTEATRVRELADVMLDRTLAEVKR